jgi:multicomponent K+:H+ antiporter subunit D
VRATPLQIAPAMTALAALFALAAFAGPVAAYLEATSAQLHDRAGYVTAVLGIPAEED